MVNICICSYMLSWPRLSQSEWQCCHSWISSFVNWMVENEDGH